MDLFGYATANEETGKQPGLRIGALASRYDGRRGEFPNRILSEVFWGRDPFEFTRLPKVSENLQLPPAGTVDGHNLMTDSTIMDSMQVDGQVPVSPLFVKDLGGRVVYTGFGPERKDNSDWASYRPQVDADGKVLNRDFNPFVPLVVFPQYCRDVEEMEGADLLESVFLTKFRCVEMSFGYFAMPSGESDEDLIAAVYNGANLFPYKLRLDTFYGDGWRLPQTQMVFAKREGIQPANAQKAGEDILKAWAERTPGQSYEDWLLAMGGSDQTERWYHRGCTLIPTFEACNGLQVVGENFELLDYWPGRAVNGLHVVVERRPDQAPAGTILAVMQPGFVTMNTIEPAQVIVSDGSGYVSPNNADPMPLLPNMNLPHQRTIADWQSTWIPTHPLHFEAPALWGWELNTGRFLQLYGPLWDPLHYYYASVDEVLSAFEKPLSDDDNRWLVPVPEGMKNRFYPVVPMMGFDVISRAEHERRRNARILPRSSLKRIATEAPTAGVGYHPLPAQFEFELDPFWFPELHPLNREQGACPEDIAKQLVDVIEPTVQVSTYLAHVDGPEEATWLKEESRLFTPDADVLMNYPFLTRYLLPDLAVVDVMKLSPVPFLADVGDLLARPTKEWWTLDMAQDEYSSLNNFTPKIADTIWNAREQGVELVKFRHMVYQTNIPLYILAWWSGASTELLQAMAADWISEGKVLQNPDSEAEQLEQLQQGAMAQIQEERPARPVAERAEGLPEEKF